MKEFDLYKKDYKELNKQHGVFIFEKQLKGSQRETLELTGKDLKTRLIDCTIRNEDNVYNDKKEFRTMCFRNIEECSYGDYVRYNNEDYMIMTDIDEHLYYRSCKLRKCQATVKWKYKDNIYEFPCVLVNDSYGVKLTSTSDYMSEQQTKLKIYVQYNQYSKTLIENTRLMFHNSPRDIYKIVNSEKVTNPNILILTCENESYDSLNDDLENNLCYNDIPEYSMNNTVIKQPDSNEGYDYEIIGEDKIKHKCEYRYSISPLLDYCEWCLDENCIKLDIAKIISYDTSSVTIYACETMCEDVFTIYAKDKERILSSKTVTITKKG